MNPSRTIWKFSLEVTDKQTIEVPAGAEFLSIDCQENPSKVPETLQLWALVDPDAETEEHKFIIHGTGHPVAHSLHRSTHIGTVATFGGQLVWHVFDGGTVDES